MPASHPFAFLTDPDLTDRPAIACQIDFSGNETEMPVHVHRKGQLILALHGTVTCTADNGMWIVPTHCGVWTPGGFHHSAKATSHARLSYLFVEPLDMDLPQECCAVAVFPMIREMIEWLAKRPMDYPVDSHAARMARVTLDELASMPREYFNLPVSSNSKIRSIADSLSARPSDRSTIAEWARRVAMSERSLARLVLRETGLTFGRWRQQLHLAIALRELANGATVQNVAIELGYDSVNAFTTMFKNGMGKTPAQYVAQRKSMHSIPRYPLRN